MSLSDKSRKQQLSLAWQEPELAGSSGLWEAVLSGAGELTAQHVLPLTSWRRGTAGEVWAPSRWYIFIVHPDFFDLLVDYLNRPS